MPEKLQLYVCEHFKIETLSVLEFIETNDVEPLFFPIRCGRPIQTNKKFSSLSIFDKNLTDSKSICACSCLLEEDKEFLDNNNIEKLYLDNCFQMFAPKSIINKLINEGAYIITPGWLSKWRVWVKQWGKKEHIKDMFSETISKLVLLDTGNDPNSSLNLKDFSEYLNIHSETIDVGLDFFKLYLENEILKWRLSLKNQNNQDNKTKIQSDYAMALDLLAHLPRAEKEEVLANRIMEVFVMMFAANKITYLSIVDSKPLNSWSIPDGLNTTNCIDKKSNLADPISRTESDKGFCIRIGSKENTLAIIELDDITFPENIVEYQNLALDMSEVIALSIENSRYFQKLLEMNKTLKSLNLTKDKLFSIIAHDLRSPFGHILNISELLIDKTDDLSNDKLKLYSNIIYTSAQRTLVLLDNLLNWAKSQTGQLSNNPKSQSLNPLIEETTEFLIPNALSKGIRLNYIATEELTVFADLNMIQTVLRNLISNAIKFTNSKGEVIIYAQKRNGMVLVTVKDNGVGMDKDRIDTLFDLDSNETTLGTNEEKGSGLGLLLCKEFVEKIGGKIWAESKIGEGSTFKFTIPQK